MFAKVVLLIILSIGLRASDEILQQTNCVWNTGLALEADIKPNSFQSVFIDIDEYLNIKKIKNGDIVWIQPQHLTKFINKYLDKLSSQIILIVNTCDHSFPDCIESLELQQKLLNSRKIAHIFAQNSTLYDHDKVTQIPIGVDFHTLAYGRKAFGEVLTSVKKQEESLVQSQLNSNNRILAALSDFQLNDTTKNGGNNLFKIFGETRTEIFEKIKNNANIYFLDKALPRNNLWDLKRKYTFSICPIGNGMDTHRVWEDLYLGVIPIVRSTPLDKLYQMFPIVIIKNWDEITFENMKKWKLELLPKFQDPEVNLKMQQSYWIGVIKDKKQQILRNLNL